MKIIYLDNGFVCVVNPSIEALEQMTIEELAQRSTPESKPFRIVEDDFFPVDDEYRDAWTIAEDLTGNIFIDQAKVDEIKQSNLKPLTRRQFKLVLLKNKMLDQIENSISAIVDDKTRARIQIEYVEAVEFHRTSESVAYMCTLLGLTDDQVDTMWEQALTL